MQLSTLGQLAVIRDGHLLVESKPMSQTFVDIGNFAMDASWSPDGSHLFFSLSSQADFNGEETAFAQFVWFSDAEESVPIKSLIADYPDLHYKVTGSYWSPDSSKLILRAYLDQRNTEFERSKYSEMLIHLDMDATSILGESFLYTNQRIDWLTNSTYIVRGGCGSPCAYYWANNYRGEEVWRLPWDTGGHVAYSETHSFMINVGRRSIEATNVATVDQIDLATGAISEHWHRNLEGYEYFSAFFMPAIAPDGNRFGFNWNSIWPNPGTYFIIDLQDREVGRFENVFILQWQSQEKVTAVEILEDGTHRLMTMTPTGTNLTQIALISDKWISNSEWSPNGQYLAYTIATHNREEAQLFLWDSWSQQLSTIMDEVENDLISIYWLPDSTGFYVTEGSSYSWIDKIWKFELQNSDLLLLDLDK